MKYAITTTLLLLSASVTIPTAQALPITVTYNHVVAQAYDESAGYRVDIYNGTTVPAAETLTATSGSSSSTATINYSGDDNSAVFSTDVWHSIDNTDGSSGDYAYSYDGYLNFTADVDTTYSISGYYDMTGDSRTGYDAYLLDRTLGSYLFEDLSYSLSTIDEAFLLGDVLDGDASNLTTGSLTGDLIAGHNYQFYFESYIQDGPEIGTNAVAEAHGNTTLVIGSVPAPAPFILLGIGLLGVGAATKRRKMQS